MTLMSAKMSIFAEWQHPPNFAKMVILTFIFTFHFCHCFKLRSKSNSPHHSWRPPSSPPLPLSHRYHHYHSVYTVTTTSTSTLKVLQVAATDPFQMQLSPKRWQLGSRFFFLFVSSFYKKLTITFQF